MAFVGWKPGNFALDDYVLRWPSPAPKSPGLAADGRRGSWEETGLDDRIAAALISQGCHAPYEIQRRIISAMLSLHHLDVSCSVPASGSSTAVLASCFHSIPDPSTTAPAVPVSVVLVTSSPTRSAAFASQLRALGEEVEVKVRCCSELTVLNDDLQALKTTGTPPSALDPMQPSSPPVSHGPHIVVTTLGRCITLLQHGALSISQLQLLVLDFAEPDNRNFLTSHHTVADVRDLLRRLHRSVQVVTLTSGSDYAASTLGRLVSKHQEVSIRANVQAISRAEASGLEAVTQTDARKGDMDQGAHSPKSPGMTKEIGTGGARVEKDWQEVLEDFEFSGLVPEDFLAVRRARDDKIAKWADRVSEALSNVTHSPPPARPVPVA